MEYPIGDTLIVWGWCTIVLGIVTGAILGLWSFAGPFPSPPGHKNYTDLPRRLNRLAHIAFFMLPLIAIVFGMHIDNTGLSTDLKWVAVYCWITCMLGVPTFLILASVYLPFKYVEVIPVSAGMTALFLMAYGQLLRVGML